MSPQLQAQFKADYNLEQSVTNFWYILSCFMTKYQIIRPKGIGS